MQRRTVPAEKKVGRVKGLYLKWGKWYWQPPTPKDGRPRPKPVNLEVGEDDYVKAVIKVNGLRGQAAIADAGSRGRVSEALPNYYAAKLDGTEATKRSRVTILENFAEITGNPRVDGITEELMMSYRHHLLTVGGTKSGLRKAQHGKRQTVKPVSAATVQTYLITVKAFINWLREKGMLEGDPMKQLNKHTRVKSTKVDEFHTVEERDAFLAGAEQEDVRLIALLGYYQGFREMEILTLTPAAVWIAPDQSRGTIDIQDTAITYDDGSRGTWKPKGKRRRKVPMHQKVLDHFLEHGVKGPWVVRPDKEKFPKGKQSKRYDARRAFATIGRRQKLKKTGFHLMRHTFGSQLAMKDVPIVTIAALLGDSIKVTEDHYAGFIPSRVNPLAVL